MGEFCARLHQLSTELAQRYRWEPAQATVFILTGLVPVLETLGATWRWSTFQMPTGRVTALSHLVLIIDPTLTPQEVSTKFQRMRQRILGAKWRDLKDRQLALARFALHCVEEEPWPQRMEAWNNDFEQWRYTNVSNFKRDCLNAIQKLLDPISPDVFENLFLHSEESHAETPRQS